MRLLTIFSFFTFIYVVLAKTNVKSLTESMGQEVIEIGALKELPPGLEEEPSAEADDEARTTASSMQPATKRDVKKIISTLPTSPKAVKAFLKTEGDQDEEARIEKELAEIYKDTADYKAENSEEATPAEKRATSTVSIISIDSADAANSTSNITDDKPIGRQGANFKFQPNLNNKADIERFRTSVDDIKCDKKVTQKLVVEDDNTVTNSAVLLYGTDFNIFSAFIFIIKSLF